MSPKMFSYQKCANHQTDGKCLGAKIDKEGDIKSCSPRDKCVLGSNERCQYFEDIVMPNASNKGDPQLAQEYQAATEQYLRDTGQVVAAKRKCPDCGNALQKGQRYCAACAEKRRKTTLRAAKKRQRASAVHAGSEA